MQNLQKVLDSVSIMTLIVAMATLMFLSFFLASIPSVI